MSAFFASLIMVPFLYRWALDCDLVDEPNNRKFHDTATPRLGGIAIYMSFLFSLMVFSHLTQRMQGLLAGTLIIFATGIVDDLHGITPFRKFAGELCAAITTIVVGHVYIHTLGNLFGYGEIILPVWLAIPFTIFAIVGVVNAFNLIDGLDGLAGGISVIILTTFSLLAYHTGNVEALVLCTALLGSLLGFLKYNFYPARMFMGDAGSLMAGFVISIIAIYLTQGNAGQIHPIVPLLVIGLPVADTVRVMTLRIINCQRPFSADRTHIHHKILDLGFEHRYTVILIYATSLLSSILTIVFHDLEPAWLLFVGYLMVTILFYWGIRFLNSHKLLLSFFVSDSNLGIRESSLYRTLAKFIANMMVMQQILVFAYLGLAIMAFTVEVNSEIRPLLIFLITILFLLYLTRDSSNQYVVAMYYGMGQMISYYVTIYGQEKLVLGVPLKQLGDFLLVGMMSFALLRFLFRRGGEFYLSSIDYLLAGVSLLLMVMAPYLQGNTILTGVLMRGIIFYVAVKVVAAQGERATRSLLYATICAMLIMGVTYEVKMFLPFCHIPQFMTYVKY
jgi:UDP-GlcNAc:undecaprenyl-phosphate GlcNAc-1-phosphate transferase